MLVERYVNVMSMFFPPITTQHSRNIAMEHSKNVKMSRFFNVNRIKG